MSLFVPILISFPFVFLVCCCCCLVRILKIEPSIYFYYHWNFPLWFVWCELNTIAFWYYFPCSLMSFVPIFFFVSLIIGFNNTILLAIALLSPHFLSICFSYFFFSLFLSFSQLWLCLLHYLLWRFLPKPKNIHTHRHIRTTSHIIILNIRVLLEILVIVLPLANALDFVTKTITTSQPTNEMKWNEMNRNLCNEY